MDIPQIRFTTTSDGVHIAYQVVGEGPVDIAFNTGPYTSNVEILWEWPWAASLIRGLAARSRLLSYDRRGAGLSDKVSAERLPTLETRAEDIRALLDAVGCERAILWGHEDSAAMCFVFAATHPERTRALIAWNPLSKGSWAPDAPWLPTEEERSAYIESIEAAWGTDAFFEENLHELMPELSTDPEFVRSYAKVVRQSLSRADAIANEQMWGATDVREVLPLIQAPSLVLFDPRVHDVPVQEARSIAGRIPGAELVELHGLGSGWDETLAHVDRFLGTLRDEEAIFERSLATVLFTDIVGSTDRATELGDRAWKDLLERHHEVVRAMLGRYSGREVSTAGDGFFATFDGPARAVGCARSIRDAVASLGLQVRCGVHAGEVETIDGDIGGMAVVIGARVGALAQASEVLVSQTVKDLTAGSGLVFEDAGAHELKGVPDQWRLYRVVA